MNGGGRTFLFAAVAFTATLMPFARSVGFEFVSYDDPDYVLENEHMVDGLTADNVAWAFVNPDYASNWHPLAWMSLMADVSLVRATGLDLGEWNRRDNPIRHVMHAHNVFLHAANAALLFALLTILAGGRPHPIWTLLLTLAWSVHPLRAEAVCWVSERKELVSVFWMLVSLILYFKSRFWPSLLCAAFALMAKPVAVTLPAVILAWDWIMCGRVRWGRFIAFSSLSALSCFMTLRAQTDAIQLGCAQTFASRLMSIVAGPVIYICQTFWPSGLSLLYSNSNGFDWLLLVPGFLLVVAIIAVCLTWLLRRGRISAILAFGVAWVYVGLVPMLGFVKVAGQEHSDRYTYWVGCGAAAVAMLLLDQLRERGHIFRAQLASLNNGRDEWRQIRRIAIACFTGIVIVLAVSCERRVGCWRDTLTLYRDAMAKEWHSFIIRDLAALLIEKQGAQGKEEAEYWLRGCAERCTEPVAKIELARFLMTKPPERSYGASERMPYLESERLLETVLATDPNNKEARTILSDLRRFRERHGGGR